MYVFGSKQKKTPTITQTVTFDICLGPPLTPVDATLTTAAPADDMSITVAPAGVVLVYKSRGRFWKKVVRKVNGALRPSQSVTVSLFK